MTSGRRGCDESWLGVDIDEFGDDRGNGGS